MNMELIIQDKKESNMIFKDFESYQNYKNEIESKLLDIRLSILAASDLIINLLNELDDLSDEIKNKTPIIDRGAQ